MNKSLPLHSLTLQGNTFSIITPAALHPEEAKKGVAKNQHPWLRLQVCDEEHTEIMHHCVVL